MNVVGEELVRAAYRRGQRKIVAWSPTTSLATQWVELKPGASANVELTLVHKSRAHKNKAGRAYGSYE